MKHIEAFLGALVVGALLLAIMLIPGTFMTMIGLGMIHSQIPQVPALSFGESMPVMVGLWLIAPIKSGGSSS